MTDLSDLYQELILDHNAHPRHFGLLPEATHTAEGFNPLCGDNCQIFVQLEGEQIVRLQFTGSGCAISKASASLMTSCLQGCTVAQAEALFEQFRALVMGGHPAQARQEDKGQSAGAHLAPQSGSVAKLAALAGVRAFPMRVKCATLPWHTLRAALHQQKNVVSTE